MADLRLSSPFHHRQQSTSSSNAEIRNLSRVLDRRAAKASRWLAQHDHDPQDNRMYDKKMDKKLELILCKVNDPRHR
jgi:hypothetical protein